MGGRLGYPLLVSLALGTIIYTQLLLSVVGPGYPLLVSLALGTIMYTQLLLAVVA